MTLDELEWQTSDHGEWQVSRFTMKGGTALVFKNATGDYDFFAVIHGAERVDLEGIDTLTAQCLVNWFINEKGGEPTTARRPNTPTQERRAPEGADTRDVVTS
jgi:hypothetical protein